MKNKLFRMQQKAVVANVTAKEWKYKARLGSVSTLAPKRTYDMESIRRLPGSQVAYRALRTIASATNGSGGDYDYDLFTIGAGSGGVRGSRFAASYGAKVAVVELPFAYRASLTTGGVGGTCVLRGCVPKKLLVYGSEFAQEFQDCNGFGWEKFEPPKHDWYVKAHGTFIAQRFLTF